MSQNSELAPVCIASDDFQAEKGESTHSYGVQVNLAKHETKSKKRNSLSVLWNEC